VEKPPRWSDLLGEMSSEELQALIADAAAAERQAISGRERVQHRKRRHAAEVELRLRTEGTLSASDVFRAALLALLMTLSVLAFAGYLASKVDGASALFGLLGLPLGAAAARALGRAGTKNIWVLALVVSGAAAVALLAQASRQTTLLIVVSAAAGLWYDALLAPFAVGLVIVIRRYRGRDAG
jgi:hypothetical protein